MSVKAWNKTLTMVVVLVPSPVEIKEDCGTVFNAPDPSSIRPTDEHIAWPRSVDHKSIKYFDVSMHVKFNSHDLIRAVSINPQFRMTLSQSVLALKHLSESFVSIIG